MTESARSFVLETPRLRLREWRGEDIRPFAAITADPKVMEFFVAPMTLAETEAMVTRFRDRQAQRGFCFWAAELKATSELIGFVGLNAPLFESHFTPCVEIGWRLAHAHWGKGYAPEGARAALDFGFSQKGLQEIIAITSPRNIRSRRVMEKLGMTHNSREDFEHPSVPKGHSLRPHVLYRLQKIAFLNMRS